MTTNRTLSDRLAYVEAQLSALLKLAGLSLEDWVSPHKAESLISLGRDKIKALVDQAEAARATGQPCTLQLGQHYRFVPPSNTVQINWRHWEDALAMPPEKWEGLE